MKWHELSWPAVEALDKQTPIVLPLGSIEQHGRHLPLAVDTIQVDAIAERAEKQLGKEAVFLPTLWLGCSEHHRDFPGTLSAPPSLYSQTITAVIQSILLAGFRRVFLLNGHGGNEVPAMQAINELIARDTNADAAHICFASWWHLAGAAISAQDMGMQSKAISHACEYETSMTLQLRPDLVRMDMIDAPPPIEDQWTHSWYGGRVRMFHRWHRLTRSGSMGEPQAASAEKGQRLLDAVISEVVAFIRDLANRVDRPIVKALGTRTQPGRSDTDRA